MSAIPIRLRGETLPMTTELLDRYNVQGPRYTSYPTAPEWNESVRTAAYEDACARANASGAPVSLYLHLPFCDEQCWFCGCFMKVVPKPQRAGEGREEIEPYLADIHREIDRMASRVARTRKIAQVHWGGGTPTYLTEPQADRLAQHLFEAFPPAPDAEVSVEVDPRITTAEHLEVLRKRGFNRVSMGVQDFDPEVQELVNRIQPFDLTRELVEAARALGYVSVNLDLIYGLPGQRRAGFEKSVEQILSLRPDRVAMYSYAHVPWLKRPQRVLQAHLPEGTEKFAIFVSGIERFVSAGYVYIGMDHFALPHDDIVKAQRDRTLTRNFQGYTTHAGCDLYGMGVSAISSVNDTYAQNTKDYAEYHAAAESGAAPIVRGHRLTADDFLRRDVITRLLCHTLIRKREIERDHGLASFDETFASALARLPRLVEDGMVVADEDEIRVTTMGRIFIRNVAMLFDSYLEKREPDKPQIFSRTL
ncbi:MAG TPA: oxygen-independent coproporphyrinogen III oxidase [Thermoanaerobaculia bacterium]|nr:oxygen-independent coproporphyrinogen III oxidase [Thermoanaerobaculia bacterium]